jgi:cation transport protein ChaC
MEVKIEMLEKEFILSGAYVKAFSDLPVDMLLDQRALDASLAKTLESRPADDELWIFGYGSLIWNPLLEYDAREIATLNGWHRSFCLRTVTARGSAQMPGRMLSLEPGGVARGVALRLPAEKLDEELHVLWRREMVTGAYTPTWADVELANGERIFALTFVANPAHRHHEPDTRVAHIAPSMARASGLIGTNADYVFKLQAALLDYGIQDQHINELATALRHLLSQDDLSNLALRET